MCMKKFIKFLFLSTLLCVHTTYPLQSSLNFLKDKGHIAQQKAKTIFTPATLMQVGLSFYTAWCEGQFVNDIVKHGPTLENTIVFPICYLAMDQMLQVPINLYVLYLIKKNKIEIIESLLQKNVIDLHGKKTLSIGSFTWWESPLHEACQQQRPEIIKKLLRAGVNASKKDEDGHTVYDYVEIRQADMVQPHDTEEIIKIKEEKIGKKLSIQKLLNFYVAKEKFAAQLDAIQQKQEANDLVEIVIEDTTNMPEYCPKEDIANIIMSYLSIEDEIKETEEKKD